MLKGACALGVATAALAFAVVPVRAGILVTGAIRDRGGAAIPGARVTAFGVAGATVGTDVALADGTFAVDATAEPASVLVSCDYCMPVRSPVASGRPVVVIIERFNAIVAAGPSAADIRALPYRSASDIATLVPFTVAGAEGFADRGLARDAAVTIDGLRFYNPADGSSAAALIPAHASASLDVTSPSAAPVYGGYAQAGTYDVRLRERDFPTTRGDAGGAADAVVRVQGPDAGAAYAVSADPADPRAAISAGASLPLAGGRLTAAALDMGDSLVSASGAGLDYTTDSRRFTVQGAVHATRTADSDFVEAGAQLSDRGPFGLIVGARAMRATGGVAGSAPAQFDAALYAGAASRSAAGGVAATVAWDHGSDAGIGAGARGSGLIGSLVGDAALGEHWSLNFGGVTSLRVPTFAELAPNATQPSAADRSLLVDGSLSYTDRRRLRVRAAAFTQRTTGPAASTVGGAGIDAAWEIAPRVALRSWLLRANESVPFAPGTGGGWPVAYGLGVPDLNRSSGWLTYDGAVRVDALVRGGALEGDVRIPFAAFSAVTIGTAREGGRRFTTVGLTLR